MKRLQIPRRRLIILTAPVLLITLAIAYSVFWWIAAAEARSGVDRWAAERRALGWTVSYGAVTTGGFPFRIELEFEQPRIEVLMNEGSVVWRTDALRAHGRPWQFGRIAFAAPARNDIRHIHLPTREIISLEDRGGTGEVTFDQGGRLSGLTVRLNGVMLRTKKTKHTMRFAGLTAGLRFPAAVTAAPRDKTKKGTKAAAMTVTLSATDLRLPDGVPAPLGALVARFGLEASLSPAVVSDGPIGTVARSWRDADGMLRIRDLNMVWGPLRVEGRGRFALDKDLQPAGTLFVRAKGFDETILALVKNGRIDPNDAVSARLALNFLARPDPKDGVPRITAPVSIRDRIVTAGPRAVARLPRIEWR